MNLSSGEAPVLGFGCAPLLGRAGRRASEKALAAAFEGGITFYDTARSYGYGEGEALLGKFLQGKRDRVVISTKFGILPVKQGTWKTHAKPLVRGVLAAVPSMRKLVRTQVNAQFQKNQFTVKVLEQSIEESLRELRTDYVDILFMHDAPANVLENEDLLKAIDNLITTGKVRAAGISSSSNVIAAALDLPKTPIRVMQFPCNVFDLSMTQQLIGSSSNGLLFVANHPFGGVMRVLQTRELLKLVATSPSTPRAIREKLGKVDDRVLAEVVLNVIARSTGIQVVIPSMIKVDHLRMNIEALKAPRFSGDEIVWLRSCLSGVPTDQANA
jgi:aryl-alcohol dehydrogenase-like predicted oxidoreductase